MSREIILELYRVQARIILGYFIKNGCSREEAEDIVQESFIKAIDYIDGVNVKNLSSWLFKVALNNYRNRLRKKSRVVELNIDEDGFSSRLAAEGDVSDRIISREYTSNIKECLSMLRQDYKDLLILKYDMELSYKEIVRLLGIPETTVKTYLFRARNEFKKIWRDRYDR